MCEEQSKGEVIKSHSNEFYTMVMDEDVRGVEEMAQKNGANCQIEIQGGASGGEAWKGQVILPLHLAACYRRAGSMQSLLSAGADAEIRDKLGRTSLHLVIINWPIVPTTGPKPYSKFWTAVTSAGRQGEACLRLLCEHGVDVNAQVDEKSQQTPLHVSVRYRALPAVRMLTSYGADVNAVDSGGMTPLHMAAGILHKDITASLISQGADVNMMMQHSGNTPLHIAAVAVMTKTTRVLEEDLCCISELLEHGAKPDILNKAGMSPLHQACSRGNEQLVDLLLGYGASVNKQSRAGENCLFLFLNHRPNMRKSSLLKKLLCLSSPLTVCNQNGRLPSSLTQPCFIKQREQLFSLTQQPKTLQDICKSNIYLKHIREKEELRKALPESLFNFVFNQWEIQNISFVAESGFDFLKQHHHHM